MKISTFTTTVFLLALPVTALAGDLGGFAVQGGADWSYGSLGDGNSIPGRSMDTLSFRVFPSYDFASVLPSLPVPLKLGVLFSYGITGQIADPTSYSNQNLRGSGYKFGIGVGTDVGKIGLQAGLNFLGSYSLSNNTASGQSMTYSGFLGGVLSASYQVLPYLAPLVVAEYGGYGKQSLAGGTASDLANKISGWSIGIGASVRYPFSNETKKEGESK